MPVSLLALAAGAFGIGTTEFIIMGLLTQVSQDLGISIPTAGTLISGYAFGVAVGAPVLTLATRRWPRKQLLMGLMLIFIAGNIAAVFAPNYASLMAARMLTSLTHGTFFGVAAVVATSLVAKEKQASAIALMFSGLTLATLLGVPAGTWIGQHLGWRMAFAAVAGVGVVALGILAAWVPGNLKQAAPVALRDELSILASTPLWLGLGMTVFGFGGVFALYTYIEPLLSQITHMGNTGVAVALLLFGAGSAVGNIAGGKLADRGVVRALWVTLGALVLVLLAGRWAFGLSGSMAMAYVALLGVVAFATVAPMQMRVMQGVGSQGATLASSFNIAAFNLGNALGAWVGGSLIASAGLLSIAWGAATLSAIGLGLVWISQRSPAGRAAAACASL